jgi:hypothetical protein
MRTNAIAFTACPPAYPRPYRKVLRRRLERILPSIQGGDLQINVFLADLFACKTTELDECFPQDIWLSYVEIEPALSKKELRQLADRIVGYCQGGLMHAVYVVRNLLNSVPKSIDDLEYYLTDQIVHNINAQYALSVLSNRQTPSPDNRSIEENQWLEELRLLPPDAMVSRLKAENATEFMAVGVVVMDFIQSEPIEQLSGITTRQRLLGRAAQFWLLHRYGYSPASLWLARFINPINTAMYVAGKNKFGSYGFGFTDAQGCVSLLVEQLPYLREVFLSPNALLFDSPDLSVIELLEEHFAQLCLGAEALLLHDTLRVNGDVLFEILQLAARFFHYSGGSFDVRVLLVMQASLTLYPLLPLKEHLEALVDTLPAEVACASVRLDKLLTPPSLRVRDQWFVLALRFMKTEKKNDRETNDASPFVLSFFDEQQYLDFSMHLKERMKAKSLSAEEHAVCVQFFGVFSYYLLWAHRDTFSHYEAIAHCHDPQLSPSLNRHLAEVGCDFALRNAEVTAKTAPERRYWSRRRVWTTNSCCSFLTENGAG